MDRAIVGWFVIGCALVVAPAAVAAPNTCAAKKVQCVAKKTAALLRCQALAVTPPGLKAGKLEACTRKAQDKFDGGANPSKGCFAKLEAKLAGKCLTVADATAVGVEVDAFVTSIGSALAPPAFLPQSCLDIREAALVANAPVPADGSYALYVAHDPGRKWTAFCRQMASGTPQTFLTVDEERNFSQLGNGTDLTTTRYRRLRIDPIALTIDLLDATFATTEQGTLPPPGGRLHVPVGFAQFASVRADDGPPAQARIDLTGTHFVMAESVLANNLAFFCAVRNDGADAPDPANGVTVAVDLSKVMLLAIDPVAGSTTKTVVDCDHLSVPDASITTGGLPLAYVGS